MLRLNKVVKRFGDFQALHGIDLDVAEGEFLTIVGPSGSGKSTLIRLMVGMDTLTAGTIELRGERIDHQPPNRRPTCMVFQSLALFPHLTVGANIEFPLKIKGVESGQRRRRALELLRLLHLREQDYDKRIDACSGGERQRVALARALAFDPEILFFDEPLSALDYRLRKTLEKELKALHERTGKTFVYITHSLEEAMVMSDRIAIMRDGRFEQIATAEDIYARPASRFVAEFMGEVNLFTLESDHGLPVCEELTIASAAAGRIPGYTPERGPLTLMVRPESIRFLADSAEAADIALSGQVIREFALGSRMHYLVQTDQGRALTVETLREDRFRGTIGERIRIGWPAETCHLIPEPLP
jgi:spermidine/putrescine transport system ATP-binding protein